MFSSKFCKIFKNNFFHRTPLVAAFEKIKAEAVVRRCSIKNVFLEISLNSQENTCPGASFLQPQACKLIKIESLTLMFFREFWEHFSKNTLFYRNPPLAASVKACNFTKIRFATGVFL